MFAGNFAPRYWALCQGQILPISSNPALFSLLGTTYGGDGQTSFALPDLRGRTPLHPGTGPGLSPYLLGQKSGLETGTLTVANLPSHTHTGSLAVGVSTNPADSDEADGNILAAGSDQAFVSGGTANSQMAPASMTVGNSGGGGQYSNRQPYLGINFILCTAGLFPSRN